MKLRKPLFWSVGQQYIKRIVRDKIKESCFKIYVVVSVYVGVIREY
jgi:hypothetical protein